MGLKITKIQKNINEYKQYSVDGMHICSLYELLNDIGCAYMRDRCDCKLQINKYKENREMGLNSYNIDFFLECYCRTSNPSSCRWVCVQAFTKDEMIIHIVNADKKLYIGHTKICMLERLYV